MSLRIEPGKFLILGIFIFTSVSAAVPGYPEDVVKIEYLSSGDILPHLIFSELERIENSNLGKIPVAFDAFRLFHPGSDQSHL